MTNQEKRRSGIHRSSLLCPPRPSWIGFHHSTEKVRFNQLKGAVVVRREESLGWSRWDSSVGRGATRTTGDVSDSACVFPPTESMVEYSNLYNGADLSRATPSGSDAPARVDGRASQSHVVGVSQSQSGGGSQTTSGGTSQAPVEKEVYPNGW